MRFGLRLTLFFGITLLAIQGATMVAIQDRLRDTLMRDGEAQVAAGETRFVRQLQELQDHLADGVRLLTLDFAMRQAVAQRDDATVISVLRNHGHRVGASRMLLVAPDGAIEGDTLAGTKDALRTFPDPDLLDRAADEDRAGRVAIMGGKPVWLVVVPVLAPDLIAFVAAALPLDDDQLAHISDIAGVPGQIGIATRADGRWELTAGAIDPDVLRQLSGDGTSRAVASSGDETIVSTRTLATAPNAPAVRVVLDYPLSEVLRRYQRVSLVLVPILTLGLLATLAGATAISRGVARPIEALARQTERIADGNYEAVTPLRRNDELGQLSAALATMTRAIAEREDLVREQAIHAGEVRQAVEYVRSVLPPPLTSGPVRAEWRYVPSSELGGDAFGYQFLDCATLAGYLIDVTGHGIASGLHAVNVANVLRHKALPGVDFRDPGAVAAGLNTMFRMEAHGGLMFTLWCFAYDVTGRTLRFCSAGHHAAFLVSPGEAEPAPVWLRSPWIGMLPPQPWPFGSVTVPPGARLYIFSDGAFEIERPDGTQWKIDDLRELIRSGPVPGVDEPQRLYDCVREAAPRGPLPDDFSMLVLDFP